MKKPNKLGWVTSLSATHSVDNLVEMDLSIVAQDPGALMQTFKKWMNEGVSGPSYQGEYTCLYCTSPNSIDRTHCKSCGAPRSFVIG